MSTLQKDTNDIHIIFRNVTFKKSVSTFATRWRFDNVMESDFFFSFLKAFKGFLKNEWENHLPVKYYKSDDKFQNVFFLPGHMSVADYVLWDWYTQIS